MPRKENQKIKMLELLKIFQQQTDEDHRLGVPQLAEKLEANGVPCERKSIYNDIDTLIDMGYDINLRRGRGGGYCLLEREFELAELKLLVDAVQSSSLISEKKSRELIDKLKKLTSSFQAQQLQRQVSVMNRIKSMNESAYYTVDDLHKAIDSGCMVQFDYNRWELDKNLHPYQKAKRHEVSPWALVWENNSYYLIAYQDYRETPGMSHYRVDKMSKVQSLKEPRRGREVYENFNLANYIRPQFNMYGGTIVDVTLQVAIDKVGPMVDRFGTKVTFLADEEGFVHFTVPVALSPQFYAWVAGFSGDVEILSPAKAREEMRAQLEKLLNQYPTEA